MSVLAIAPMYNTPGKKDAAGAFQPEAQAFVDIHGGRVVLVDNHATKAKMRNQVLEAILLAGADLGTVALFCHGWRTGIQFGFGLAHVESLADACGGIADVVLYACNTADGTGPGGDGGFADALRDAMCAAGHVYRQVDAHDRPGHTTRNPYVRRFQGQGSPVGGVGGAWVVAPGSSLWKRWVAALKGDLRLRFPLMNTAEIHRELLE